MQKAVLSREEKGRLIAENPSQILQMDERHYKVASQSRDSMYDVTHRESGSWLCNCLDFHYRALEQDQIHRCKHIIACQIREQLREKVRENVIIKPVEITACIFCHSTDLRKFGVRHNKYGDLQRFLCADCKQTFSVNVGFERMKHSPQGITTAMQLYFSGESLRNTARSLRLLGSQVSKKALQERSKSMFPTHPEIIEFAQAHVWSKEPRMTELRERIRSEIEQVLAKYSGA